MQHLALYRKWRPMTFDDVVGQKHATETIKNEVASGNVGHAFLFCGPRGTGKTSTARIFARAVNCLNNKDGNPCNECEACRGILNGSIMDVTEIDAASNSGVDNVRSLREEAEYAAAAVKNRVYIIDEVHALSKDAFNALLKLLEEPPAHVKFVLATTEANKVLETISSRCQRFDFKKITKADIRARLEEICQAEEIEIASEALTLIASAADGSLRDALTILEPCVSKGKTVDTGYVKELLGVSERDAAARLCLAVGQNDGAAALGVIEDVCAAGINLTAFTEDIIRSFRAVMVYAITNMKPPEETDEDWEELLPAAESFGADKAIFAVNTLSEAFSRARYLSSPRYVIEAALLRLCNMRAETEIAALEARIGELEKKFASGIVAAAPQKEIPKKEIAAKKPPESAPKPKAEEKPPVAANAEADKIKEKWPEIISKVASSGKLNLYMALENSALRAYGDKVAIVFADKGGETFRSMIEGDLPGINEIVREETGLDVKLTVKLESDFGAGEAQKGKDPFDEIASLPFVNNIN
ncbi:MAG: DNA polymerase III subunit gamma/tau [Clostridia bacterium]|nr:DNA polymerase III subunit gamma/tau [Clostridia bacterium]